MNIPPTTTGLCPHCLRSLPATLQTRQGGTYLHRHCPDHGQIRTLIWQGPPDIDSWRRSNRHAANPERQTQTNHGCPQDCGICPQHKQFACTVLLEITQNCNLHCPVCFASSGGRKQDFTPLPELARRLTWIRRTAGDVILQISGGEPTLHQDLPELIRKARELFEAVQLNTNGLELARDENLAYRLKDAGLSWVFLQFDGTTDDIYRKLRGKPLLEQKLQALDNCAKAGLSVVLVPTVARGVNDEDLGNLLRMGLQQTPEVRGVHFQPMSLIGRNAFSGEQARLTLPELLRKIVEQSRGLVELAHFSPPGCEHERCSFYSRYWLSPTGGLVHRPGPVACCAGVEGVDGAIVADSQAAREDIEQAMRSVRSNWSPAERTGHEPGKSSDNAGPGGGCAFEDFLQKPRLPSFSLTGMAFQDAWTMDLQRLQSCCVHVYSNPDKLIPFCAYNLTDEAGKALHRF